MTNGKKGTQKKEPMKYKNTLLILVSLVLFAYAGMITIFPTVLTNNFDEQKFGEKIQETTSLVTKVGSVDFQVTPTLDMIITVANLDSKYIDAQDCFQAQNIQITTNPLGVITKNFTIKKMVVRNAKYDNQTLANGKNKLAFLPKVFNPKVFGADKMTIAAGPVEVKNYTIADITPKKFSKETITSKTYTTAQVKRFLSQQNFTHVKIK